MTVTECLIFAGRLKLRGSYRTILKRVKEVISELKLQKCQDTKIGGPLVRGVSGGERKRTSIGVEMITDPNLIFLDEPTTGLDSFTATNVVELLMELAEKGRTVIATIHQPNSDIFEMFDQLMLMAKGKIIYHNEASKAVDFFKEQNFACPDLNNPADYFMTMMSIEAFDEQDTDNREALEISKQEIQRKYEQRINAFSDFYEASELKNDADNVLEGCEEL